MKSQDITLLLGDATEQMKKLARTSVQLVVSSPPYNIGKIYERDQKLSLDGYLSWQADIISEVADILVDGGSVCWQTGNYVSNGELFPLDVHFYSIFKEKNFKLRNRIIWKFNFGLNADKRFSGRYETLLWLTKGDAYKFNLDPVRIPQLYPGKRHGPNKGLKAGSPSGNPLGKNPADVWEFNAEKDFLVNPVWDIPNVKNNHPEKTSHPCQYPVELAERCVLALTDEGDTVLDPFVGVGSTLIAAAKHGRRGIGIDREPEYIAIAEDRLRKLRSGDLSTRPIGKPVRRPRAGESVARVPDEWLKPGGNA